MAIRVRKLPAANTVASGKTATIEIPNGQRLHAVTLTIGYDAANASKETAGIITNQIVTDVRVILNGKVQRNHSLKQLAAINLAKGTDYQLRTSGTMGSSGYREYVKLHFAEPWRKEIAQQAAMAWNLNPVDVRSMQVQVDFATISSPFLEGSYEVDELQGSNVQGLENGRLGVIGKVRRQTFPAVGSIVENAGLLKPKDDSLQALYFMAASDGKFINTLKFTVDGAQYQEEINYLENRARLFGWGLNPDTNANSAANYLSPRFDVPLDADDPINHALRLRGVSELTFRAALDAASAGTIDVLAEAGGPPD